MNESTLKAILSLPTPVLFVGAAGVGKTHTVKRNYDHVEVLLLSSCSEEDIGGLPYRDGVYDRRTIPAMFERIQKADAAGLSTALFLDEIDKADRSVADTLLTLVAGREINGNKLPQSTKIVLAANTPEYGGGDGLSIPMLNRCIVIDFQPDPAIWASDALEEFKSPSSVRVIQSVLSGSIPILETVGEGIDTRTTSPRSLLMALQAVEIIEDKTTLDTVLRGLLTPNAATKILAAVNKIEDEKYAHVFEKSEVAVQKSEALKKTRKPIEI